jgi:hypothetical protein
MAVEYAKQEISMKQAESLKRRLPSSELHDAVIQKIEPFLVTAERTSNAGN